MAFHYTLTVLNALTDPLIAVEVPCRFTLYVEVQLEVYRLRQVVQYLVKFIEYPFSYLVGIHRLAANHLTSRLEQLSVEFLHMLRESEFQVRSSLYEIAEGYLSLLKLFEVLMIPPSRGGWRLLAGALGFL